MDLLARSNSCVLCSTIDIILRSIIRIYGSTYIFFRRALRFMLITFLYHVILIILQSDWRCQHSSSAELAHEKCA